MIVDAKFNQPNYVYDVLSLQKPNSKGDDMKIFIWL